MSLTLVLPIKWNFFLGTRLTKWGRRMDMALKAGMVAISQAFFSRLKTSTSSFLKSLCYAISSGNSKCKLQHCPFLSREVRLSPVQSESTGFWVDPVPGTVDSHTMGACWPGWSPQWLVPCQLCWAGLFPCWRSHCNKQRRLWIRIASKTTL